ncbi:hypothetical protein QR680_018423 [Steinernema hermaphroditum]|uniref:BTB domain-containing protein n=1 Tax=Steinernema hermaphroditum TaxID=289476 RepID=A0AA39LR00_9BILA|nr:hypothetical protein QR680_018423 [Steinernema hermaphroditum]
MDLTTPAPPSPPGRKQLIDCVVSIGNQQFFVNRQLLAQYSGVFHDIFDLHDDERLRELDFLKASDFWTFWNVVRANPSRLCKELIPAVATVAHILESPVMTDKCQQYVLSSASGMSLREKLRIASRHWNSNLVFELLGELDTTEKCVAFYQSGGFDGCRDTIKLLFTKMLLQCESKVQEARINPYAMNITRLSNTSLYVKDSIANRFSTFWHIGGDHGYLYTEECTSCFELASRDPKKMKVIEEGRKETITTMRICNGVKWVITLARMKCFKGKNIVDFELTTEAVPQYDVEGFHWKVSAGLFIDLTDHHIGRRCVEHTEGATRAIVKFSVEIGAPIVCQIKVAFESKGIVTPSAAPTSVDDLEQQDNEGLTSGIFRTTDGKVACIELAKLQRHSISLYNQWFTMKKINGGVKLNCTYAELVDFLKYMELSRDSSINELNVATLLRFALRNGCRQLRDHCIDYHKNISKIPRIYSLIYDIQTADLLNDMKVVGKLLTRVKCNFCMERVIGPRIGGKPLSMMTRMKMLDYLVKKCSDGWKWPQC